VAIALFGAVQAADESIQRAVQAWRPAWLERPMRAVSDAGNPRTVLAALLGIALLDTAAGVATGRLAVATLIPVNLAVEGLKRSTFRARPDGERKRSNAAFPSSHAANAAALAWVLARRWRRLAPAFHLFAATVAFSRVFLNRHWASDVVAGAALGCVLAWAVARWADRRKRPAAPAV
jgi:undecaprenyl-diphosphatase